MADEYQRTIRVKTLECTKLRQVIEELNFKNNALLDENNNLKQSIAEANAHCRSSIEDLNEQLSEANTKLTTAQDELTRCQEDLVKFKRANQELLLQLQDANKQQPKLDEEIATLTEKNCRLTFDLSSLQQENRALKVELESILSEVSDKEQMLQKTCQDFCKTQQQNESLYEEIKELTNQVKERNLEMQTKEFTIARLAIQLEESNESLQKRCLFEKEVEKLRKENSEMRLEIQEWYQSGDRLTDTLLKNKQILAENKKAKNENQSLLREMSFLKEQEALCKEEMAKVTLQLKMSQEEVYSWKEKSGEIARENQALSKLLADTNEELKEKHTLEEKNRLLNAKWLADAEEMEKLKQSLLTLLKETSNLKRKIEDLERSNVQKLHIIAKLKCTDKKSTTTT